MTHPTRLFASCLIIAVVSLMLFPLHANGQPAGIPSIEMTVPQPSASDPAVVAVRLLVDVSTTGPVELRIEKTATNSSTPADFGPHTFTVGSTFSGTSSGSTPVDEATFESVTTPVSGADQRAEVVIQLSSNFDASTFQTTLTGDETWSIETVTGGITGACPISFIIDQSTFTERALIGGNYPTPPVQVSGGGQSLPEPACESFRPGVDAVLVLDKSGSMSSSDLGTPPQPKIDALSDAVTDFVNVWSDLRSSETLLNPNNPGAPVPSPSDQLALVFFDRDVTAMPWVSSGLQPFNAALQSTITGNIGSVTPGGATSLGDGLLSADTLLGASASGNRKVILAMSDGKENSNARVDVDNPASPTEVRTFPSGTAEADKDPLPNQNDYQIYTVTVGTSTAVSADINEDIATATGGFYINSEDDADQMRPFFLQLLQNFLRFNSQQIVHLSQRELAFGSSQTATFPVTSTSTQLSVNLLAKRSDGYFRMTLTSPNGDFSEEVEGSGALRFTRALPIDTSEYVGEWTAELELVDPSGRTRTADTDLFVLTDDVGVDATFEVLPNDYEPGDDLQLRARLSDLRGPITGLSSQGRVEARIVRPGVSIGELLAESSAQPSGQTSDPASPADAKLEALLEEQPELLDRVSSRVTLVDDGSGSDATAGDGVYSGAFQAETPGHYNVLFLADGPTERSGDFARAQVQTVHVRAVPNEAETSVEAVVQNQNLLLTVTPRALDGSRMAGFGGYFWLTADQGTPIRLQDQLDGSYIARVPMNGSARPRVDLHFLRVSSPISRDATPETLPVEIGEATAVVAEIQNGKEREEENGGDDNCFPDSGEGSGIILFSVILVGGILVARRRRMPGGSPEDA